MLRFSPSSFSPNLYGHPFQAGYSPGGYIPVDLNRFLQTGDVFQSAGSPYGQPQDDLQRMQAQMLGALLMQLDPMMLVQMIMASMLSSALNGGGGRALSGLNRGSMGSRGFANRRAIQSRNWSQPSHSHSASRTDGPRTRGERGIPNGLRPNAANGARIVRQMGFTGTIGGIGQRANKSDHPHGNAIDVMTHNDTRMGWRVAEHFRQNHQELGVKYVIYQQQIASPRTGWQWRPMADRGSPTANHMDHPHISFY